MRLLKDTTKKKRQVPDIHGDLPLGISIILNESLVFDCPAFLEEQKSHAPLHLLAEGD